MDRENTQSMFNFSSEVKRHTIQEDSKKPNLEMQKNANSTVNLKLDVLDDDIKAQYATTQNDQLNNLNNN